MKRLKVLYADFGFDRATTAELLGTPLPEVQAMTLREWLRRWSDSYWHLTPEMLGVVAERLGLTIDAAGCPIQKVHATLRVAVKDAARDGRLDWTRVDALCDELPALVARYGLSDRDAERFRHSHSFGGSFRWHTERGDRPRGGVRESGRAASVEP